MNRFCVDEEENDDERTYEFDWYLGVQTMLLTCKTNCIVKTG